MGTEPPVNEGTVKATLRWSEVVTLESEIELDTALLVRRGFDPESEASILEFLQVADDFDGDDWWDWSCETDAATARRIDADGLEIEGVTIRRDTEGTP